MAVFGKDIPGLKFSTSFTDIPLNKPAARFHNYSLSEYHAAGKVQLYECTFGATGDSTLDGSCTAARISTNAQTASQQAMTCAHPAKNVQAEYFACPITISVDGNPMATLAKYQEPIAIPETPKYNMCSCLLMWFRTEFLLEWVWYHTVAHGLEKVFVYDNDSGIDHLEEMVGRLKRMFNMEYVPWNVHKIQPAYHGHCAMKAASECEWVSFTDIDEFVFVDPEHQDGRLSSVLAQLSNPAAPNRFSKSLPQGTQIGGVELRMVTTSSGDVDMTKKPAGGVMRNYGCTGKSTNWKSFVRPRAVHQSMLNAIHYYSYNFPQYDRVQFGTGSEIRLYHYKNQAWEVYMRKYVRRASPATRGFNHHDGSREVTADKPDATWAKNVQEQCVYKTEAPIKKHARCLLSPKRCSSETPDRNVLIVGIGGVGSGLMWVKHHLDRTLGDGELNGKDNHGIAVKEWRDVRHISANTHTKGLRYRTVLHHVRHPLAAVLAMCAGDQLAAARNQTVRAALATWIFENQMMEMVADSRYRIEDVGLRELCSMGSRGGSMASLCIPLESIQPRINFGPQTAVDRARPALTWPDLEAIDPLGAQQAMEMAVRYGYTVHESWWKSVGGKKEVLVKGGEKKIE